MIFRRQPGSGDAPSGSPQERLQAELARLRTERQELIKLCLYARDRLDSEAAARRIDERLEAMGIVPVVPDGQRFDPAGFEAAAIVETDDPLLHDTVAETEIAGYCDRGTIVREPVVSVYRATTVPDEVPAETAYDVPVVSDELADALADGHRLPEEVPDAVTDRPPDLTEGHDVASRQPGGSL